MYNQPGTFLEAYFYFVCLFFVLLDCKKQVHKTCLVHLIEKNIIEVKIIIEVNNLSF